MIVKISGNLSASQQARLQALGLDVSRHLPLIHSVAGRVPTRSLGALAALPFVTHLSSDGSVRKCDEFTVASSGADVAAAQYGVSGSGVTVAVVDSGIRTTTDLPPTRVLASVTFVPTSQTTSDDCGHGTHVAGIIGGTGYASTGIGPSARSPAWPPRPIWSASRSSTARARGRSARSSPAFSGSSATRRSIKSG